MKSKTKSIYNEEYNDELVKYTLNILDICSKKLNIDYDELVNVFVDYHKGLTNKTRKKKTINKIDHLLEFIIIDNNEYLVDNITNELYTNDNNQIYVGKYDVENDVIIL